MIRACVIGLGGRGFGLLKGVLLKNPDIEVVAVCDLYEDRLARGVDKVKECGGDAKGYTDYKEALNTAGLDAAFVFSDWSTHAEIAIHAMRKGIAVASEVGCEYSLENCHQLVRVQEETGTPYMFMENCCWNRDELLATAMARKNMFGTIVHCAGAYGHDLRNEVAYGHVNRHYRFDNYLNRCCENYPTHELGPIAKILNINSGNRMVSLTSTASKAAGLNAYGTPGRFNQGDVVNTLIKCAGGETILLTLDTTLPRYYSRDFTIRGVKGMYEERTNSVFIDGEHKDHWNWKPNWNNAEQYMDKYEHPIWDKFLHDGVRGGHGGIDWLEFDAFLGAIERGIEPPIDTYDTAAWMAITPLSEESIANGGAPVAIPDFTHGKWMNREPAPEWEYSI